MRPSDVVDQLREELPRRTDLFTRNFSAAIVVSSGTATATAAAHGLAAGDAFNIYDSDFLNVAIAVAKDGLIYTFQTTVTHDLTFGFKSGQTDTVELSGFPESVWNDTFTLVAVPTNDTFSLQSTNATAPTLGAGGITETGDVNGFFSVATAPDDDTFTFTTTAGDQSATVEIVAEPRITVVPDFETAERQYTEQDDGDFWMFVIPGAAAVSKDRHIQSDVTTSKVGSDDIRSNFSEPYSLIVFAPSSNEEQAVDSMDTCRDTLLSPILKSINGIGFGTGTSESGRFKFLFAGHQLADYRNQWYAHEYQFEQAFALTNDDRFVPTTKAFRSFDNTIEVNGQEITSDGELP